jgi:hypothetical protein
MGMVSFSFAILVILSGTPTISVGAQRRISLLARAKSEQERSFAPLRMTTEPVGGGLRMTSS